MEDKAPEVSIVIVVGDRRKRSAEALTSVLNQAGIKRAEVLLVDYASEGTEPLAGSDHPLVRTIRKFPPETFGHLKAEGVRQAKSPIVAFLEDHIVVQPGWLESLLLTFEGPWAGVGAEVHNANPGVGTADTLALINYGRWEPPLAAGEADMLAGNNTAYRRQVLMEHESELDELLISDTVLQWVLQSGGHKLYVDPSVSLKHRNPTTLVNGIKAEFYYHWCFGAVRTVKFAWPWWKRLGQIALSPVVPWLRLRRLMILAKEKGPEQYSHLLRNLFPALIILSAAVIGQDVGYLVGLSTGAQKFTEFELNSPRPLAEELAG